MNWIKLRIHKGSLSSQPDVWVCCDSIEEIRAHQEDACMILFQSGRKEWYQITPDNLLKAMKELFDNVRSTECNV